MPRTRTLNRVHIKRTTADPTTLGWQTWVPATYAATPADALEGWDPTHSTDPRDYPFLGIFGDCDWETYEDALGALTQAQRDGHFRADPTTPPVDSY